MGFCLYYHVNGKRSDHTIALWKTSLFDFFLNEMDSTWNKWSRFIQNAWQSISIHKLAQNCVWQLSLEIEIDLLKTLWKKINIFERKERTTTSQKHDKFNLEYNPVSKTPENIITIVNQYFTWKVLHFIRNSHLTSQKYTNNNRTSD